MPAATAPAWPVWSRRALVVALALSVAIHAVVSLLDPGVADPPAETPLTATIETLPPPPLPAATPTPSAAGKPKPARRPRPAPAPTTDEDTAAIVVPADEAAASLPAAEDAAQQGTGAAQDGAVSTAPTADAQAPPGTAPLEGRTLPPRVDLAYKVFFGTRGFQVGEATYRFEHADSRYRIATVGQARGLAALLLRGQGRLESAGIITPAGLRPLEFTVDRFNGRGREKAQFDWQNGVLRLEGDRTEPLAIATFDPLALMWQYYFTPPDGDRVLVAVATTRRVANYTLTREGRETLPWANGTIETERWMRVSDDGRTEATAWLAPELRFIPVKMRVTNTTRGTLEAVLDAIRVDESGATVGRDDVPLQPSPPAETHDAASHDATPGYSPPGATFPSMTP